MMRIPKWENAATPPTTYITVVQPNDDVAVYGLDGDDLVVTYGNPPDWDAAGYGGWGAEFPETEKAAEALLHALRAERTVLGDTVYACDTLGFSLNEHAVLKRWVVAKKPAPGTYVVGETQGPLGMETVVAVVHHDLYITRKESP